MERRKFLQTLGLGAAGIAIAPFIPIQIPKAPRLSFTESELAKVIGEIIVPAESNTIMMYTGLNGMYDFNLYMMRIGTPMCKYWHYHPKRYTKIIVLNLYEKHGLYKAIIHKGLDRDNDNRVSIMKGTVEIVKGAKFEDLKYYLHPSGIKFPPFDNYIVTVDPYQRDIEPGTTTVLKRGKGLLEQIREHGHVATYSYKPPQT